MYFCYRSCEEGRGETGGQVEGAEALGLVPWDSCAVMLNSEDIDAISCYVDTCCNVNQ